MTAPLVSVVILAFNHGSYIRQCIESAIQQAGDADIEILIGDDCSTDSTEATVLALLRDYPGKLHYVRHEQRLGGSDNYRFMLARARGNFIAHLDGDDYWLPGKLAAQLAVLRRSPRVAAVYTNAITVNERGERIGIFNDAGAVEVDLAALLRHGNFLNNSSMLFRSELLPAMLEIEGPILDYRVHLTHAQSGTLVQLADCLSVYRVNSTSSSVATLNEMVRLLYWNAILAVPRTVVRDVDLAQGIADFARRVFFRALKQRDLQLFRIWLPVIAKESPMGKWATSVLVLRSIVRAAVGVLASAFRRRFFSTPTVLYVRGST